MFSRIISLCIKKSTNGILRLIHFFPASKFNQIQLSELLPPRDAPQKSRKTYESI